MKNQKSFIIGSSFSKIALLSLLLFFIGVSTSFAQSERGKKMRNSNATPTEKAEKRSQKWKTEFSLTDTQTAQVKTALEKRITATDALKGQEKSDEKKAQRKAIASEFDSSVKSILTSEQYAQYEQKKADKKAKMKENRGKRGQGFQSDEDDF